MSYTRRLVIKGAASAAAIIAAPGILRAQTAVELNIGSSHPLTSLWVGPMKSVFQAEVETKAKAAGITVTWREAYGGTLYKFQETMTAVRRKFVDIGWVGSIWEGKSLPLSNISYFAPFASDDVGLVVDTIDELTANFQPMADAWTKNGMVYLGGTGIDTAHLWTTFPVSKLDDLKGRKFSTAGLVASLIRGTGAVAVNSAQTNFYTDVQTGVTDGIMTAGSVLFPTRAYEVAKYMTRVGGGAMCIGGLAVNKERFESLPGDLQSIIRTAGRSFAKAVSRETTARTDTMLADMVKAGNIETVLADAERRKWIAAIPNLADEFAKGNPEAPVKEAMRLYMQAIRKGGGKPARDWDQA
jgi:TRAP-type C4-dicarboxylate transport system substrate-binding protein